MKFLIEVNIPTEVGNKEILTGRLLKQVEEYMKEVNPEVAYFGIKKGVRTVFMIIDIDDSSKIPEIVEPLWLDWHAEVNFTPVMDAQVFERARSGIGRVVRKRLKK